MVAGTGGHGEAPPSRPRGVAVPSCPERVEAEMHANCQCGSYTSQRLIHEDLFEDPTFLR